MGLSTRTIADLCSLAAADLLAAGVLGRRVDEILFSLNECSFRQKECLRSVQTNFYRTFGRFVSALILNEHIDNKLESTDRLLLTVCCDTACYRYFIKVSIEFLALLQHFQDILS